MDDKNERKDKSLASFKLSKISNLIIWPMSQLWAVVGTVVLELKHIFYSRMLPVTLHLHCSASFNTDECYERRQSNRLKNCLTNRRHYKVT